MLRLTWIKSSRGVRGRLFSAMNTIQTRHSVTRTFRLLSARTAKRWGRWFVFAWLAMWVSTALQPCCEVTAAVARHEQVAHSDCGQPDAGAPDSDGSPKHAPCHGMAAPALASPDKLAVAGGNPTPVVAAVSAVSYVLPFPPGLSLPIAYRAAPPPVAVYLRSLRLLI